MNLDSILGSIVIGGIISGLVSFMINKRQSNLQYITAERKEWRKEIREISYKLCGASYKDTLLLLTSLKTRINGFGNNSNKYSEDAHIWEIIRKVELSNPSMGDLKILQEQMIEYLSLLLKDDWERTKKEVKGDSYNNLSIITLVAVTIYFTISIFYGNQISDISVFDLLTIILSYIVLIIFSSLLFGIVGKTACSRIIEGTIDDKPNVNYQTKSLKCYLMWGVLIFVMWLVYGFAMANIYISIGMGKLNEISNLLSNLIYILGITFQFIYQLLKIERHSKYYNAINKTRGKYLKKSDNNKK